MLAFLRRLVRKSRPEMYGLDHAVLNIQLPPQTMWMNLGYWEVRKNLRGPELRLYTEKKRDREEKMKNKPKKEKFANRLI